MKKKNNKHLSETQKKLNEIIKKENAIMEKILKRNLMKKKLQTGLKGLRKRTGRS